MAIHMDLEAELKLLREENARLKANKGNTGGIKVSAKGAVSVYGMGRFPVTLYKSQWLELLNNRAGDILAFIKANNDKLRTKDGAEVEDEDEDSED